MGHPQGRWSVLLMTQHGGIPSQFQGDHEGCGALPRNPMECGNCCWHSSAGGCRRGAIPCASERRCGGGPRRQGSRHPYLPLDNRVSSSADPCDIVRIIDRHRARVRFKDAVKWFALARHRRRPPSRAIPTAALPLLRELARDVLPVEIHVCFAKKVTDTVGHSISTPHRCEYRAGFSILLRLQRVNGPKKRVWGFNHECPVYPKDICIYRGYKS